MRRFELERRLRTDPALAVLFLDKLIEVRDRAELAGQPLKTWGMNEHQARCLSYALSCAGIQGLTPEPREGDTYLGIPILAPSGVGYAERSKV